MISYRVFILYVTDQVVIGYGTLILSLTVRFDKIKHVKWREYLKRQLTLGSCNYYIIYLGVRKTTNLCYEGEFSSISLRNVKKMFRKQFLRDNPETSVSVSLFDNICHTSY